MKLTQSGLELFNGLCFHREIFEEIRYFLHTSSRGECRQLLLTHSPDIVTDSSETQTAHPHTQTAGQTDVVPKP